MTTASPAAPSQPGFWSRVWSWMGLGGSRENIGDDAEVDLNKKANLELEGELFGGTPPLAENERETEAQFMSVFWRLGRDDAGVGQEKDLAKDVIQSKTELDWVERQLRTKRTVDEKKARQALLNGRKQRFEDEVKDLRGRRWHLSSHPSLPPRRMLVRPLIYWAVGIAAFVAEAPLAGTLVDAFEFPNTFWGQLASPGVILMLSLFGIAFKILFDVWSSDEPHPSDERKSVWTWCREHKVLMRAAEVAVVVLCVSTIYMMAGLRTATENVAYLEKRDAVAQGRDGQVKTDLIAARQRRRDETRWPMLILAITLPVFAGLVLTTGTSKWVRNNHDIDAFVALDRGEKALAACLDELAVLDAEIQAAERRSADETGDGGALKQAYLRTRLDIYSHGYGRGKVLPEDRSAHVGVYDLHTQALRRLTKRQIRATFARQSADRGVSQ